MKTFRDAGGREWVVSLDAPLVQRVRDKCAIDLVALDGRAAQRMLDDPVLLVDTLWTLCMDEGLAAGIGYEQFARGLTGDALDSAAEAMVGAIADFFPSRPRRLFEAIVAKGSELRELAVARALAEVERVTLDGADGASPTTIR